MAEKTDLLIIGAGCAGLSLALNLVEAGITDHSITVVDPRTSFHNDRTWCFWNLQPHLFEDAVSYRWANWRLAGSGSEVVQGSSQYSYQHLSAEDFYRLALQKLQRVPNVQLKLGQKALSLTDNDFGVLVETNKGPIEAKLAFDSRPVFPRLIPGQDKAGEIYLYQHFKGFVVEVTHPLFDPTVATLMDYRVDQSSGIHFIYMLPFTERTALVEATYISPRGIPRANYEQSLKDYLQREYGTGDYAIKRREEGLIPMSTVAYPLHPSPHVYNIGGRGGMVRPSTGYAFSKIQQHSKQLAQSLTAGCDSRGEITPFEPKAARGPFTNFMDRVFLSYLQHYPERAPSLFEDLFARTEPEALVRFLSEQGSSSDILQVVKSLPVLPFIKEVLQLYAPQILHDRASLYRRA